MAEPPSSVWRFSGGWLLWRVADEIDRRQATIVPGSRPCRACGGRGTFAEWGQQEVGFLLPDATGLPRSLADRETIIGREIRWDRVLVCDCVFPFSSPDIRPECPTRPDTVSLAWLVGFLAELPKPAFDWPAQWLVDLDWREAQGDDSWQAVWWAEFMAWTRGAAIDVDRLQRALDDAYLAERLKLAHANRQPSIAAAVRAVVGVTSVCVLENRVSGDPAERSLEVLVEGGEDEAVAAAIYSSMHRGIPLIGTVSVILEGSPALGLWDDSWAEVRFSRPSFSVVSHGGLDVTWTAHNVAVIKPIAAQGWNYWGYSLAIDEEVVTVMSTPGMDVCALLRDGIYQNPVLANRVTAVADSRTLTLTRVDG
jgi:hypothetical protein